MKLNRKMLCFVLILFITIISCNCISATTDKDNTTSITDTSQTTSEVNIKTSTQVQQKDDNIKTDTITKNNKKTQNNLKTDATVTDWASLQYAVSDASSQTEDTTITLGEGTYTNTGTIKWSNTKIVLTIDGNGQTIDGNQQQVFYIVNDCSLVLTNIIIQNANSSSGGAIENYHGNLNITNSTFTNNTAESGGAIEDHYGNLNITNSTFTNNTAERSGGAICSYGTLTINNTNFNNNTALSFGGAIYNGNTLTINNSRLSNNTAGYGGAIYADGNIEIFDSTFTDNIATLNAGSIDALGKLKMVNSIFNNNTPIKSGGGIHYYEWNEQEIIIINSIIDGELTNNLNITNTRITAKVDSSTIDNTMINITLTTSDDEAIPEAEVSILNNNNEIATATTDRDGKVTIKLELEANTYNLTVKYSGNESHTASQTTLNVTVEKIATKLSASTKNNTVANTTIEVTLLDTNNNAITNAQVVISNTSGKQLTTITTDSNGKATAKLNLSSGNQTITIKYNGNNTYKETNTTQTINIQKHNTKITTTTKNNKVTNTTIEITLTDTTLNKQIANAEISVLDKNSKVLINTTTNSNGKENITLNLQSGKQTITVKYAGDNTYNKSNTTLTINVQKLTPTITLNFKIPANANEIITVTSTIKYNNQTPTGNVTFKLNNKNIQTVKLSNGQANINITINSSGKNNITAVYNGNDNYNTCNVTKQLQTNKVNTKLTIKSNNTSPKVNEKVKLILTLNDANNNLLTDKNITVKVNNKDYTLTTNKSGVATVEYTMNKNFANLTAKAVYAGNNVYMNSSVSLTLNRTFFTDVTLLTGSFDVKPGDTVKLIAHITDNGLDINGGKLAFKIDGTTLKDSNGDAVLVDIKEGFAILEYKIPDTLSAGTRNLSAAFSSGRYSGRLSTPMIINRLATHIDVNPIYTTDNTILVQAQVVDQNNQALNKQTPMCIKFNGKSYNFNTTNGTIKFQINQTLKDTYYNLTIISGANGKYLGSTTQTTVIKTNTTTKTNHINNTLNTKSTANSGEIKTGNIMSLLTGASTVKPGDTLKLIAHITNSNIDITGGQLGFKIDGVTLNDSKNNKVFSPQNGLAILEYKVSDTLSAGTRNLSSVYSSSKYGNERLYSTLTLNKLNTHIEAQPVFTNTSSATIKANIYDDNNQLINRQTKVVIKIDGTSYTINNTNGKINYKVPTKLSKGVHQITIIAGENGKYYSSRANTVVIRT